MIQLDVTHDDIREMNDRYNSEMCDIGTANAVSIALRKRMNPKYTPIINFASRHNACELRIGETKHSLPPNLYWWLRESQNGVEMKPATFLFVMFSVFLIERTVKFPEITNRRDLPIAPVEGAVPIFNEEWPLAS